jgi:hypothetical protein
MSAATARCDRIIALIDECLADDGDRRTPASGPDRAPLATGGWWRYLPSGPLTPTAPLRTAA